MKDVARGWEVLKVGRKQNGHGGEGLNSKEKEKW